MEIQSSSFFIGNQQYMQQKLEEKSGNAGKTAKVIDGRSFTSMQDQIAQKRAQAQKKALQIVGNAFNSDTQIDDDINAHKAKVKSLIQEKSDAQKSVQDMEDTRESLREALGIAKDSQEEQDLKLLEKEKLSYRSSSKVCLTDDEMKQIQSIKENGLTEYQQTSMTLLTLEDSYISTIQNANQEIKVENRIITATENEQSKSQTMLDAQKQANEIMDNVSSEIIGILADEAKEHIDEENEKTKEKAKEEEKEKEEIQERIDAAKQRKEKSKELTETIVEGASLINSTTNELNNAQQEVKDMMSKMKLIEEDIKGAAVDANL